MFVTIFVFWILHSWSFSCLSPKLAVSDEPNVGLTLVWVASQSNVWHLTILHPKCQQSNDNEFNESEASARRRISKDKESNASEQCVDYSSVKKWAEAFMCQSGCQHSDRQCWRAEFSTILHSRGHFWFCLILSLVLLPYFEAASLTQNCAVIEFRELLEPHILYLGWILKTAPSWALGATYLSWALGATHSDLESYSSVDYAFILEWDCCYIFDAHAVDHESYSSVDYAFRLWHWCCHSWPDWKLKTGWISSQQPAKKSGRLALSVNLCGTSPSAVPLLPFPWWNFSRKPGWNCS